MRAGHAALRPGTSLPPSLPVPLLHRRPRKGPLPARPACGPRHSQVAAAGQDEKDLRAIDGEKRAARRQQEHGGPALPTGLGRPRGQGAWASWGRGPPRSGAAAPGARGPGALAAAPCLSLPHRLGRASRWRCGCGCSGRWDESEAQRSKQAAAGASPPPFSPPSVDRSEPALSLALAHVSNYLEARSCHWTGLPYIRLLGGRVF